MALHCLLFQPFNYCTSDQREKSCRVAELNTKQKVVVLHFKLNRTMNGTRKNRSHYRAIQLRWPGFEENVAWLRPTAAMTKKEAEKRKRRGCKKRKWTKVGVMKRADKSHRVSTAQRQTI